MTILEQTKTATSEARGFEVTDTSDVTFFDVKAMLARDYAERMMLPPAEPTRSEKLFRILSLSAGPLLLVAGYVGLSRLLF